MIGEAVGEIDAAEEVGGGLTIFEADEAELAAGLEIVTTAEPA